MPPLAVKAIKSVIRFGSDNGLDASLAEERRLFTSLFATADQKEGMTAFMENVRPPIAAADLFQPDVDPYDIAAVDAV